MGAISSAYEVSGAGAMTMGSVSARAAIPAFAARIPQAISIHIVFFITHYSFTFVLVFFRFEVLTYKTNENVN